METALHLPAVTHSQLSYTHLMEEGGERITHKATSRSKATMKLHTHKAATQLTMKHLQQSTTDSYRYGMLKLPVAPVKQDGGLHLDNNQTMLFPLV